MAVQAMPVQRACSGGSPGALSDEQERGGACCPDCAQEGGDDTRAEGQAEAGWVQRLAHDANRVMPDGVSIQRRAADDAEPVVPDVADIEPAAAGAQSQGAAEESPVGAAATALEPGGDVESRPGREPPGAPAPPPAGGEAAPSPAHDAGTVPSGAVTVTAEPVAPSVAGEAPTSVPALMPEGPAGSGEPMGGVVGATDVVSVAAEPEPPSAAGSAGLAVGAKTGEAEAGAGALAAPTGPAGSAGPAAAPARPAEPGAPADVAVPAGTDGQPGPVVGQADAANAPAAATPGLAAEPATAGTGPAATTPMAAGALGADILGDAAAGGGPIAAAEPTEAAAEAGSVEPGPEGLGLAPAAAGPVTEVVGSGAGATPGGAVPAEAGAPPPAPPVPELVPAESGDAAGPESDPMVPDDLGFPVQRLAETGGPRGPPLQRFSLSSLNPIEAAKKATKALADKVLNVVKQLGASALNTAKGLGSAAMSKVASAGSSAWQAATSAGQRAVQAVRHAGQRAVSWAMDMGRQVVQKAGELGRRALQGAQSLGRRALDAAGNLGRAAWEGAKRMGRGAWNTVRGLGRAAWSRAKGLGQSVLGGLAGMAGRAWGAVRGAGTRAFGAVKGFLGTAWGKARGLGSGLLAKAKSIGAQLTPSNLCKAVAGLAMKAFNFLKPYAQKAWNAVKRVGSWVWDKAKKGALAVAATATAWVGKARRWVTGKLSAAKDAVMQGMRTLKDGAKRVASQAWSWAKGRASAAWNGAKRFGAAALAGASHLATGAWNTAKQLGARAVDGAKRFGTQVKDTAVRIGTQVVDTAKRAGTALLSVADSLTGGMASKVAGLAKGILGKAAGVLAFVMSAAKDLADRALSAAKDFVGKALAKAKELGRKAWDKAKDLGRKALDRAKELGKKAWDKAKDLVKRGWDRAKELGRKAVDKAKDLGRRAWSKAKELGSKAISTAKDWGKKALTAAGALAGKAWSTIKSVGGTVLSKLGSAAKAIGGFVRSVGGKLKQWGKALGLDKLMGWIKGVSAKAFAHVKDAAAKVWEKVGPYAKTAGMIAAGILTFPASVGIAAVYGACKLAGCAAKRVAAEKSAATGGAADVTTDLLPIVSTGKDLCKCLTGENVVTGKESDNLDRGISCVSAAIDIVAIVAAFFTGGTSLAVLGLKGVLKKVLKEALQTGIVDLFKLFTKAGRKHLLDLFSSALSALSPKRIKAFLKSLPDLADDFAEMLKRVARRLGLMDDAKDTKKASDVAGAGGSGPSRDPGTREPDVPGTPRDPGDGMANAEDVHVEDPGPRPTGEPHLSPHACPVRSSSFGPGTPVLTPGGPRRIETLQVGDPILGHAERTGAAVTTRVIDTPRGNTSTWVDVTLGGSTVRATPEHPFWSGGWSAAASLRPGMGVRIHDGSTTPVGRVHRVSVAAAPTYNLSVERTENYFVGAAGALVHNITKSRQDYMSRPGYKNYVLRDASGKVYYSGMFGPNMTVEDVKARHSKNHNRFSEAANDVLELQPGTREYGEARLLEQKLAVDNDTIIGRDGDNYRGNRQNPLSPDKAPEYEEYRMIKAACG